MIASIAADFRNAAQAIEDKHWDHPALSCSHVLIEIGRAYLDGADTDVAVSNWLRGIAGVAQ